MYYFMIVDFIAEILLNLDQLDCVYQKDIAYGEYFKLTVDLYFDRSRS